MIIRLAYGCKIPGNFQMWKLSGNIGNFQNDQILHINRETQIDEA